MRPRRQPKLPLTGGIALAALALTVTACGSAEGETDTASGSEAGDSSSEWPPEYNPLIFPTGSQGGGGYSIGTILAGFWSEDLGVETEVQAGGTQTNVALIEEGQADLGNASVRDFISFYGEDALESTKIRDFWALYDAPLHIVVPEDSPHQTLSDMAGSGDAISIGAPDSGEALAFYDLIECGGFDESDFEIQTLGKDESVTAYQDGLIEAWSAQGPVPMPQFSEVIETGRGGRLIDVDEEMISCMEETYRMTPVTIGSEYGVDDINTFTLWYSQITSADVPEEVVYELAKVTHERYEELVAAYPGAALTSAESTAEMDGFGLHPGTERYLQEIGVLD